MGLMLEYRVDKDSLGEVQIPSERYYGPFTGRAVQQYKVTGQTAHANLIKCYVMIKRSTAIANKKLKALDEDKADEIIRSCDEVLAGKLHDEFVVDAINSGAGTAFNMNTNEVIANRALEILGKKKGSYEIVSPNDHVNMSQSSNDTFPTAMHVAILLNMEETIASLDRLIASLQRKAKKFSGIVKIGRTHLMDAIPVTLGAEFEQYAYSLKQARARLVEAMDGLRYVGLGGTAVGTGVNTPKGFRQLAIQHLSKVSGLDLKSSENMFYSLQSKYDVANCSSALRNLAIDLNKIANDIRLMASGPTAGFAEIVIPAVHAGSSLISGEGKPTPS